MKNPQGDILLKLDSRGRVTIGTHVTRNSLRRSPYYRLVFGEYGSLHLLPVKIELEQQMEVQAA